MFSDVSFLNLDRTGATISTNYRPNPAQLKGLVDFSIARHRIPNYN